MKYGFATPFATSPEYMDYGFLKELKAAGYDYCELPGVLIGSMADHDVQRLCSELKDLDLTALAACSLMPASKNVFTAGKDEIAAYLDTIFERFSLIGIKAMGFGSGAARMLPEGMAYSEGVDRYLHCLNELFIPRLERYDMQLFIEALRVEETNFINCLDEAVEVVEKAGSPRIHIVADTMHMICAGETADSVRRAIKHVGHVHISELDRLLPEDSYSPDCLKMLHYLLEAGYEGTITFETKHGSENGPKKALTLLKGITQKQS